MAFEHYLRKGGRKLRLGFTTGTCAALAARAAARMLLTGRAEAGSSIVTPAGLAVTVELEDVGLDAGRARCAVRKDAGDDPDVTNGVLVYAEARRDAGGGVSVDGGSGVGRVTRPGLDQPIGAAAINRVPRRMIERGVREVCDELGYEGGVAVVISIPDGERIARRTFNPRLGIVGGLSVIGTSGIVTPMSDQAMIDAILAEMKMHRASGVRDLVIVPGNYGEDFLKTLPELSGRPYVRCSNFIGEALDAAAGWGFRSILLVGHLGKLVKLAGGIMDTHSRVADCRMELMALHAALAGVDAAGMLRLLSAVSVEEGLAVLDEYGARGATLAGILARIDHYMGRRAGGDVRTGAVAFSSGAGLLGVSAGAEKIMAEWGKS